MYTPRTAASLLLLFTLGGCAIQRGEIVGKSPLDYKDTAFISVNDDEYFWIAPPVSGPHGTPPAEMQRITKDGVWVREGWFIVEFQCFTPSDRPAGVKILPESDDQKPVYIHAGHRYKLSCSPTRVGDIVVQDVSDTPAR